MSIIAVTTNLQQITILPVDAAYCALMVLRVNCKVGNLIDFDNQKCYNEI